jgi:hypothetical protein
VVYEFTASVRNILDLLSYRVLMEKPEGRRSLVRPISRWEDNIKIDLIYIYLDGVDWIYLARSRGQVAGCCERGNELSGSINCGKCLGRVRDVVQPSWK